MTFPASVRPCRKNKGTADVFNGIVIAGPSVSVQPIIGLPNLVSPPLIFNTNCKHRLKET